MERIANILYEALHHGVTEIVVVGGVALVMAWTVITMVREWRVA